MISEELRVKLLKIAAEHGGQRGVVQTPTPKPRDDCIHLGPIVEYKDSTGSRSQCPGVVLRECAIHDSCRLIETWSGVTCKSCRDYSTTQSIDPQIKLAVVTIGIGDRFEDLARRNGRTVSSRLGIPDLIVLNESHLEQYAPPLESFKDPQRRIHWLKFAIPQILPNLDRWVWIDADYKMVRAIDRRVLFAIRNDPRLIAAECWWESPPAKPYFNAGFYVANRAQHGRLFDWCRENYFTTPETFGEQCVWNAGIKALGLDVLVLPREYNTGKPGQCSLPIGVHGYWYTGHSAKAETLARFDETNLYPQLAQKRFNPSIINYEDGYLFAFRTGWAGSQVWVVRLNQEFKPVGIPVRLGLTRKRASDYGREDPRLFWHKGQVHVMFTGVSGRNGPTNVLFARLNDKFVVEDLFHPIVKGRQSWEKNHVYFDRHDVLFALYMADPKHRVMRVRCNETEFVHSSFAPRPWSGGLMRGGACPVQVEDEFWHFFHSRQNIDGHLTYEMGLYTFNVNPPFQPLRIIPDPVIIADRNTKPPDQYCSVIWPGGAVLNGNRWIIATGVHDRWSEIIALDHRELCDKLIAVKPE